MIASFVVLLPIIFLNSKLSTAEDKTINYISFETAEATSTANTTTAGGKQYAAENALSRGSRMWCSSGGHSQDEVCITNAEWRFWGNSVCQAIQWTGSIVTPRTVKGVKINWGYAAGEFMIETSYDNKQWTPTIGWVKTEKKEESFAQDVLFPQSLKMRSVRISMKTPLHGYYGINFVALISDSHILVMITSGISSAEGEMCLLSESGKRLPGTPVVLDSCLNSLAVGDGREIFRFSDNGEIIHVMSHLCVTLKDNSESKGGEIILAKCQEYTDGRSNWEVQANSQLKMLRSGDFCLTQQGSRAGSADMAIEKTAATNFPRAIDKLHSPDKAVDGNPDTYFATQEFDAGALPETVDFKIDLGAEYKVLRAEIDWVYAASRGYVLADGSDYKLTSSTVANSINNTINGLHGLPARYIQLQMTEPHNTYSVHDGKSVYGISRFSVFVNRLKSVIEPCTIARESKDARDKYFLTFVSEFDTSSGSSVVQKGNQYLMSTTKLESVGSAVAGLKDGLEMCNKVMKGKNHRLSVDQRDTAATQMKFQMAKSHFDDSTKEVKTSQLKVATEDTDLPDDCTDVLQRNPNATDGFYNIKPPCAKETIRVYCDMKTQTGLYVDIKPPNASVWRPEDMSERCSSMDLEPFVITSIHQASTIQRITQHMMLKESNSTRALFPIGTVKTADSVVALDLKTDISPVIGNLPKAAGNLNALGIVWEPQAVTYFDWSAARITGALCQTRPSYFKTSTTVDLQCNEAARNNHKMEGCPYSWVLARCPESCSQTEKDRVYGFETYRDDSPICLSAVQADGIGKYNLVNVTFLPGMNSYEGATNKNGIHSLAYGGTTWDRSFRVTKPVRICPNSTEAKLLSSPQSTNSTDQVINKNSLTAGVMHFIQTHRSPISSKPEEMPEMKSVKPGTEDAAASVLLLIGRIGGIDSEISNIIAEKAFEAVSLSRSKLKPSEELHRKLETESEVLDNAGTRAIQTMFGLESVVLDSLSEFQGKLQQSQNAKEKLWGFKSFSLPNINTLLSEGFWKFFKRNRPPVSGSLLIQPPLPLSPPQHQSIQQGSWFMAISPPAMAGREGLGVLTYLDEDSLKYNKSTPITEREPLAIQNKIMYDGVISFDFYAEKGTGSFAILFRMTNEYNSYIYEVRQERGIKRLLKVVDSHPIELATKNDGGYLNNVWYSVRIELKMDHIKVDSAVSGQPLRSIFSLTDGSHVSGTMAFSAIGVDLYIDRLSYQPNPCQENPVPPPPPLPPHCSIYQHREIWRIDTQWHPVQPPKAEVEGVWGFKKDVSGRSNVIVQYTAVSGTDNQFGTLLMMKRHRYCEDGIYSVDFFPQCAGLVGLVYHYAGPQSFMIVEFGPDLVRIRRMEESGEFNELASMVESVNPNAKYILGQWNSAKVNFTRKSVTVTLNDQEILHSDILGMDLPSGGRVGLSAWRCGGVGFDRITLSPISINTIDRNEEESTRINLPVSPTTTTQQSLSQPIFTTRLSRAVYSNACHAPHILDRRVECEKLLGNDANGDLSSLVQCQYNFCETCCNKSVSRFLESTRITGSKTGFQWQRFQEETVSLYKQCLLECAKSNHGSIRSSELLASATQTCNSNSFHIDAGPTIRRRNNQEFLAAWEAFDELQLDNDGNSIAAKCQKCCRGESEDDLKVAEACQSHCTKAKNSFDWKLFDKTISLTTTF